MRPISIEFILKNTLKFGTFIALTLITIGGVWSLIMHGNQPISSQQFSVTSNQFNISNMNLTQLGIFILVLLQIVNVGVLFIYYLIKKDLWYIAISFSILLMLVFSLVYQ